jgi:hypothetical protein
MLTNIHIFLEFFFTFSVPSDDSEGVCSDVERIICFLFQDHQRVHSNVNVLG